MLMSTRGTDSESTDLPTNKEIRCRLQVIIAELKPSVTLVDSPPTVLITAPDFGRAAQLGGGGYLSSIYSHI